MPDDGSRLPRGPFGSKAGASSFLSSSSNFSHCHRCICPFSTLPLVVEFRDLSGRVIRTWQNLTGAVLQEVVFWVWRELFMSIIAKRRQYEPLIKAMIRDIERSFGGSHHIILFGGSPGKSTR